jgi:hypothetical protein
MGGTIEARHRIMHIVKSMARAPVRLGVYSFGDRRDSNRPRRVVSMLGSWSDPLPLILSNLHLLRHPRSLLRSQFAVARASRLKV